MRKTQQNKARPVYAVVGDGDCERWYVDMLRRHERDINVKLKPELAKKSTLKKQYEHVCELAIDYDHVFWLVDYDVILKQSREARKDRKNDEQMFKEYYQKLQKKKNITVIINNPCLEYWVLLHYHPAPGKSYNDCSGVEAHLCKHCSDYEKTQRYYTLEGRDIYLKLKPNIQTAIGHARASDDGFDIHTFDASIARSQMYQLFEKLKLYHSESKL